MPRRRSKDYPPLFSDPDRNAAERERLDGHFEETTLLPSVVFAQRLRERREERGLSLVGLSRLTTAKGRPISKSAIQRLEQCEKGLLLDDAFALTEALAAVPANMLIPPEGKLIRLSESLAVDGADLRKWFSSGLPYRSLQRPAAEIAPDVEREESDREIARLARNFLDLVGLEGEDGKEARYAALQDLKAEVRDRG